MDKIRAAGKYYRACCEYRSQKNRSVKGRFFYDTFTTNPPNGHTWAEGVSWQINEDRRFIRWEAFQLIKAQALIRSILARRAVHFALLSPDTDALPRAVDYCMREEIQCAPWPDLGDYIIDVFKTQTPNGDKYIVS